MLWLVASCSGKKKNAGKKVIAWKSVAISKKKEKKRSNPFISLHLRLVRHSSPPHLPSAAPHCFPVCGFIPSAVQCSAVEKPILTVLCFPIQLHCLACGDPEVWLSCAEATLCLRYHMGTEHQGELLYLLCKSSKQQRSCVVGLNV